MSWKVNMLAEDMCISITDWPISIYILKPGPSEPRLESEEEIEDDAAAHEAEEQGFAQEEEFIDVSHSMIKLYHATYGHLDPINPYIIIRLCDHHTLQKVLTF